MNLSELNHHLYSIKGCADPSKPSLGIDKNYTLNKYAVHVKK